MGAEEDEERKLFGNVFFFFLTLNLRDWFINLNDWYHWVSLGGACRLNTARFTYSMVMGFNERTKTFEATYHDFHSASRAGKL